MRPDLVFPAPPIDGVLVATLADACRTLQAKLDSLDTEVRRLRNKVTYLESVTEP